MMNLSIYKCPMCNKKLRYFNSVLRCSDGHSFDIAKEGYVNLLLPNQKRSRVPGNDRQMSSNRRDFLNKDYYHPLAEQVNKIILDYHQEHFNNNFSILDNGCGEGYYADKLYRSFREKNDNSWEIYGIDVSKYSVKLSAKRNPDIHFSVVNTYFLPFFDDQFDVVFTIFSPICQQELERVLKKGGLAIVVSPGSKHLYSLIKRLYDKPREHGHKAIFENTRNLDFLFQESLNYWITIDNSTDIHNLISITPYYWNCSQERILEVKRQNYLKTEINFDISIFRLNCSC